MNREGNVTGVNSETKRYHNYYIQAILITQKFNIYLSRRSRANTADAPKHGQSNAPIWGYDTGSGSMKATNGSIHVHHNILADYPEV